MNTRTRRAALGHRGIEYEYRPPWQTDFEKSKGMTDEITQ
jgi:hypothetical protein